MREESRSSIAAPFELGNGQRAVGPDAANKAVAVGDAPPTGFGQVRDGVTFSVVIPCRLGTGVPRAVGSVLNVNYPAALFEVLLVRGSNPSLQRNLGARMAKGDVIAFTDDDCQVPPEWLAVASGCFNDGISIVGGPNLTPPDDPLVARTFGQVCSSPIATASMSRRYRKARAESGVDEMALVLSNLFCRRSLFESGLQFSPELFPNEENHFMNGASRMGHRMGYNPDLYVYHPRKQTWSGFFRQFMGYGAGRGKQTRMDPRSLRPFHLAPPIFSLGVISAPLLALLFPVLLPLVLLSALAYALVIGAESVRLARVERGLGSVPFLMSSFFLLHLAYGLGIIAGLACGKGDVAGKPPTEKDVTFFRAASS